MSSLLRFHVADYIVFGLTLILSMATGIYHAVVSKPATTKEYLLANRKMMSLPVALSLLASFMSGITILGVPSEIYTFGTQYWLVVTSYVILFPAVALIFVPTFYELGLTSSYEVNLCMNYFMITHSVVARRGIERIVYPQKFFKIDTFGTHIVIARKGIERTVHPPPPTILRLIYLENWLGHLE